MHAWWSFGEDGEKQWRLVCVRCEVPSVKFLRLLLVENLAQTALEVCEMKKYEQPNFASDESLLGCGHTPGRSKHLTSNPRRKKKKKNVVQT